MNTYPDDDMRQSFQEDAAAQYGVSQRHREHLALFDELAAEENPALTVDNPLIRH